MTDIQLHYIEQGQGQPLILLHGNGESCDYFEHQVSFFAKDYNVIAIDTRGHGKSPRGEKPFTIVQFAEDLHDFMDEKGITKANLLGFSDGGNIALTFALKYPERIDKMIIDGANLFPRGVKPLYYDENFVDIGPEGENGKKLVVHFENKIKDSVIDRRKINISLMTNKEHKKLMSKK